MICRSVVTTSFACCCYMTISCSSAVQTPTRLSVHGARLVPAAASAHDVYLFVLIANDCVRTTGQQYACWCQRLSYELRKLMAPMNEQTHSQCTVGFYLRTLQNRTFPPVGLLPKKSNSYILSTYTAVWTWVIYCFKIMFKRHWVLLEQSYV